MRTLCLDKAALCQISVNSEMTRSLLLGKRVRIVVSIALGLVFGTLFLMLGISHNAQLEFVRADGEFDYLYAMKVFAAWLLLSTIISYLLLTVIAIVFKKFRANFLRPRKIDSAIEPGKRGDHIGDA